MQTIRCAACGRRYDYRQAAAPAAVPITARLDGNGWAPMAPYTTGRDVHRPRSAPVRYAMRKRYALRSRPASPERKRLHPLLRAVSGW